MKNANFILSFIVENNPAAYAKKAQVGVDLSISRVSRILGGATILADPLKPIHGSLQELNPNIRVIDGVDHEVWYLSPGIYDIGFDQGLKPIPATCTALIFQRSTLGRNGAEIRSSVYDPGFTTPAIGAILYVHAPITIEKHTRVAQILFFENEEADLYNGQYMNR